MEQTQDIGFADKIRTTLALVNEVKALVVTTAQEYAATGEKVSTIRGLEKALEAEYKEHPVIIEAKRLQVIKGDLARHLEDARKYAKCLMMDWEDKQEAARVAEENRLQAIAKKQAEDEAIAQAQVAQDAGQHEEAEAIISEPVAVPIVVIPKAVVKVAGHTRRMVPKFRIINSAIIPRQYLMPNEVAIGGVIRSLKGAANIPGIEYYEEAA